ncbi:C-X-C motif chemokine 11-1 [Microcaecilia unicolor]|uniref:C-X-C motif chemokine 11-1-like n=1 Tax=Microcaecilia unicolor TaxID=1415580 RepID=A0A6P7WYP2_9AMPH|nr:C-X-C motif chemokine 11-1-like [Microcaecilia unicolor]
MDLRCTVPLCLLLLFTIEIQGSPVAGRGRCLCKETGSNFVRRIYIEKLEVYPQSASCEHREVIVTIKQSGEKRCLNPNSEWVRRILTSFTKKA